jgi:Heterokaryon incompatibility protein (HET)
MEKRLQHGRYVKLPTQHSFRLLEITNRGPPITFSLLNFEIGSHPDYTALSYTWGDPVYEDVLDAGNRSIYHPFPNQKRHGKLKVTSNLHDALLQLQRSGLTGYLWIDAICIDQSNAEERNHQVNMMCEIYEKASHVLVWLGKEDESASVVISLLHRLARCVQDVSPNLLDNLHFAHPLDFPPATNNPSALELRDIPDFTDEEDSAISVFLNRRWFRRIWIIQEVVLAAQTEVLWGTFTTSWKTFSDCINHWQYSIRSRLQGSIHPLTTGDTDPMAHSYIIRALSDFASGEIRSDLLKLPLETWLLDVGERSSTGAIFMMILRAGRSFRSKEPEDKVFGLLGLIQKAARVRNLAECSIKADYGKPVAQVYAEATFYMIREICDLLPLSMVSDRSRIQIQDLPSWAIDFSVNSLLSLGELSATIDQLNFNAGRGWPILPDYATVRGNTMCVRAHVLDEVVDTGEATSEVAGSSLEPYLAFTLRCPKTDLNGQNRVEVLWRTLIWDFGLSGNQHPASDDCSKSFRFWLLLHICKSIQEKVRTGTSRSECLLSMNKLVELALSDSTGLIPRLCEIRTTCDDNGVLEDGLDTDRLPPPNVLFCRSDSVLPITSSSEFASATSDSFMSNTRIYRTRKGYVGLGPFSTRKGDVVVIAAGGKIPFLLRPVESQEELRHQLMGETYVHGIMHGEAVRSSGIDWKEITLV